MLGKQEKLTLNPAKQGGGRGKSYVRQAGEAPASPTLWGECFSIREVPLPRTPSCLPLSCEHG